MRKNVGSLGANEILKLVFAYLAELSSVSGYEEVLHVLAKMGAALTSAERCSVWVVSNDRKTISTKVAQGIESVELPIDSGIVGDAICNGRKIIIDDVYDDLRFNKEIDIKTGYKTKSMMVIPMYDYHNTIIGAFQVINHIGESDFFDERDMERLSLASRYAAEAITAAKLTQEIEETQREVVFTMGAIGESRSEETGNHVKRVAEYSKLLALAYGLSEEEAELLKQASPMHDIGKIAIPDSILNKPGKFDENERYIMNKHAELGYNMIKNSNRPLLQAAAIVAYEHHEKWDGSGYPNAKRGEDIHIFGRITAIADVFDALGSDRVYKKAWSDEKIFELLQRESGKHFDPKLIDLFFENLESFLEIRETFRDVYLGTSYQIDSANSVTFLGAYGTRSKECATSCIFLNERNVIDAGNLLNPLDVRAADIENIWITHAHLDHIVDIASVIDNYFGLRKKSLKLWGLPQTLQTIKENFLNDAIWPDFSKINLADSNEKAIVYMPIELEKEYSIDKESSIRAIKTDHTVESCGYIYQKNTNAILITQDTYSIKNIIEKVNSDQTIKALVVECSFSSDMYDLAIESKHLTPSLLFEQLEELKRSDISLYVNHLKPSYKNKIADEIDTYRPKWEVTVLKDGDIVNF